MNILKVINEYANIHTLVYLAPGVLNSYLTAMREPALQQGKITVPQCEGSKIWLSVYF